MAGNFEEYKEAFLNFIAGNGEMPVLTGDAGEAERIAFNRAKLFAAERTAMPDPQSAAYMDYTTHYGSIAADGTRQQGAAGSNGDGRFTYQVLGNMHSVIPGNTPWFDSNRDGRLDERDRHSPVWSDTQYISAVAGAAGVYSVLQSLDAGERPDANEAVRLATDVAAAEARLRAGGGPNFVEDEWRTLMSGYGFHHNFNDPATLAISEHAGTAIALPPVIPDAAPTGASQSGATLAEPITDVDLSPFFATGIAAQSLPEEPANAIVEQPVAPETITGAEGEIAAERAALDEALAIAATLETVSPGLPEPPPVTFEELRGPAAPLAEADVPFDQGVPELGAPGSQHDVQWGEYLFSIAGDARYSAIRQDVQGLLGEGATEREAQITLAAMIGYLTRIQSPDAYELVNFDKIYVGQQLAIPDADKPQQMEGLVQVFAGIARADDGRITYADLAGKDPMELFPLGVPQDKSLGGGTPNL